MLHRALVVLFAASLFASCWALPVPDGKADAGSNTGTGGNTGTGAGSGITLEVVPPSAVISMNGVNDELFIAARVNGTTNQAIVFTLEGGPGRLSPNNDGTAFYSAWGMSTPATASIRVTSLADTTVTSVIPVTITGYTQPFFIVPYGLSWGAVLLAPNTRQSFAAWAYPVSGAAVGVSASWYVMPHGTITPGGTVTTPSSATRTWVFARSEDNVWAAQELDVQSTTQPSVAITPDTATVAPHGVVQLTASVSTGAQVEWSVESAQGGEINATGTYTAPGQPGVYVVAARVVGASRFGAATIIVR